eukprot:jgi/Undpi1/12651/HiC_scaffold_6.g02319.m1
MDEKGGLMCNSLEKAEDAPLLLFRVPMTKENTGGANVSFRHGSARAVDLLGKACKVKKGAAADIAAAAAAAARVWTGDVIEEEDFEGLPRSISMTWSDCDVEAFLLQMIVPAQDGRTVAMTSVPCELTSGMKELCILQKGDPGRRLKVARSLAMEVEEGVAVSRSSDPDLLAQDDDLRLLHRYLHAGPNDVEEIHGQGLRRISSEEVAMPSGRILQSSTTIDVMVLYTTKSKSGTDDLDGPTRSNDQMETDIITAYEGANNALKDSLGEGAEVFSMRSPTAAFEKYGYSVVHTNCLVNFSHIHEIGHNLGANHDKVNSDVGHAYAYGFRHCQGKNAYRTIMAYESGCVSAPRVNIFSNPDKKYANVLQGSATENNARVIRQSASPGGSSPGTGLVVNAKATSQPTTFPSSSTTSSPGNDDDEQEEESTSMSDDGSRTSPSPTTAVGGHYEGCYNETLSDFEMANIPVIDPQFTTQESCDVHCEDAGYAYFALEFGFLCQCGDVLPDPERAVGDDLCDLPCANPGTNRTCGGNWHSAIFVVGVLDTFELPEAATTDAVDDDVVLFSDDGRQSGFGPRSVASFGGTGDDDTSVYVSLVMETDDFEAPTPSPSPLPPPPSS